MTVAACPHPVGESGILPTVAIPLPSRTVLAVTVVASVGLGAGGYALGRDMGTEDAQTEPVPALSTPKGGERPKVNVPGRMSIPPPVKVQPR